MGDPQNYRNRALECAVLAAGSGSPQHQAVWLELEHHWRQMADTVDHYSRVDPFAAFIVPGVDRSNPY